MKTNKLNPWSRIAALALGAAVIFTSCQKDDEVPESAPDIPPSESMVMDFDSFESDSSNQKIDSSGSHKNHNAAALTVLFWSAGVAIQTAIPVLAFQESFNHEATYNSDTREWVWSYNFGAFNAHKAALHASVDGSNVIWKMYITLHDKPEVLWFEGVSATDGSGGTWRLYKDADNPVAYLDIEWSKNEDGADLKYTYLIDDVNKGNYISYGLDASAELDASFDIYGAEKDEEVNIDWSRTNKNGRIKAPSYFEDNDFHCWDTAFEDVDCE